MKQQIYQNDDLLPFKKVKKYLSNSELKDISSKFLRKKRNANLLVDLLDQFHKPSETPPSCVSAVENVFVEIIRRGDMAVSDTANISEAESQYKDWLAGCYEDAWTNLKLCLQNGIPECKLQAINSLFKLLLEEAKFPLKKENKKKRNKSNFPVNKLKDILQSLSISSNLNAEVLKRFSEYAEFKDVFCNTWLAVESLLKDIYKNDPDDKQIWNILLVLSQLPKPKKGSNLVYCDLSNVIPEDRIVRAAVESVWQELATGKHTNKTHQLLLVVLVEHIMPQMDNVIFLTDYFMDALNRNDCEISMLALQGVFNLVIKHNIEYPDIYGKLYQLFTIDALKARYKTRLFALADEFLRSTHVPLVLVAAFAKRFSRLLLAASPPDMLILLTFIANLLISHPDLKSLCHSPSAKQVEEDPYLEDEREPLQSRALQSQLWEVDLMRHHHSPKVATLAATVIGDLPSTQLQLEPLLHLTWHKMIKKDIKKLNKTIAQVSEKFKDKPLSSKLEEARQKELQLTLLEINDLFELS